MSAARIALMVLIAATARSVVAQELGEDDVERRLHFIESRLKAEATQARWYEAGWSIVYVSGLGYGAYQIAQAQTNGALAEGIVGASKSVIGAAGLALQPLEAARGTRELDEGADSASGQRDQRLALAETLLRRNAKEADIRYAWQPHVISLLLNLVGGAIIWIAGDLPRAAQSTGLALAVGELSIWTRPWGAKRDLREYNREFGGLAFKKPARTPTAVSGPSVRVAASGVQLTF
ncbi:MAG: hypothetical protein JWN44_5378 [Myxococcales bacterium]|nr:hypothetical protein [Myxococcales bacterium]